MLKEELSASELFKLSHIQLRSAKKLNIADPIDLISIGFLLHLSLELFFKGCCKIYNIKYKRTHNLIDLINPLKELYIDDESRKTLEDFNEYHYFRYIFTGNIGSYVVYKHDVLIKKILEQSSVIQKEYEANAYIYDETDYNGQKILALKIGGQEIILFEKKIDKV